MKAKAVILATILAIALAGCGETKTTLKKDQAAKVDGVAITYTQVKAHSQQIEAEKKEASSAPLQQVKGKDDPEAESVYDLVWEQILLHEAKKMGVTVKDFEVDARIKQIKTNVYGGNEQKMEEAIKAKNSTMKGAREDIKKQIIGEKLKLKVLTEANHVTDKDIKDYYAKNKKMLTEPDGRYLRHMLFKTKADADKAKTRLDAGEDFATLAKELSLDTNTKDQGGDLGLIEKGVTTPAFEKAAFSLKEGAYSEPVKTMSGWNIVKVDKIQKGGLPPLAKIKEDIRKELIRTRSDNAMNKWYKKVLKENTVELATEFKDMDLSRATSPHIQI